MSQKKPYAHTPRDGTDTWQSLECHLRGVGSQSADFAEAFDARDIGMCAGYLHDLGKASDEFQSYLERCYKDKLEGKKPPTANVDHKLAGAARASKVKGSFSLLAIPIIGHHGGMTNISDVESRVSPQKITDVEKVIEQASSLLPLDLQYTQIPSQFQTDNTACELFLRMIYSCLVDADSLNTEAFWEPEKNHLRQPGESISNLWDRFQADQKDLTKSAKDTPVNRIRSEIYTDCVKSAELHQGVFRLTVPTGGGKTRSGMAFALKHATIHELQRVIVAIPYTSIIDQNAGIYRDILGEQNVLEHHSAIDVPDSDQYSEEDVKKELAAENWDVPVVVTTTVQLFESLFSNMRSKCRKLHNLARSVIILDEVQTLPLGMVQPIISILRELVENYHVTLVLSTATQPAFEGDSPYLKGFTDCMEIVSSPKKYFDELKRVEYRVEPEPWAWERVAEEMRSRDQVLCVLNSRKDAVALYKLLDDPEALHLSTLMCPAHRREALDEIRRRLDNSLPCRVISTQVVEAGVDLDFPCVMRATGPLDRIVQAAGRCNREGRMSGLGEVIVFTPEEGRSPIGAYSTAMADASRILSSPQCDLSDPDIFNNYFELLWQDVVLDARCIELLRRRLDFKEVANRFRMIDGDTISVITNYNCAVTDMLETVRWKGSVSRNEWRILQQFSVSVFRYDFDRFRRENLIKEILPGLYQWRGTYNHHYGISDDLPDPTDLIVVDNNNL